MPRTMECVMVCGTDPPFHVPSTEQETLTLKLLLLTYKLPIDLCRVIKPYLLRPRVIVRGTLIEYCNEYASPRYHVIRDATSRDLEYYETVSFVSIPHAIVW